MDHALFEQLLLEEESATLDFKRDQYPLAKAADAERSEVVKDILGFANAFRRSDAYILVGVEDVRGGRSSVVGVSQHLDDHSLQQFLASVTNQPIQFSYEAFTYEGHKVGVIRIGRQTAKPFYLKKDFGKLRANIVYIRRGSGTDVQRPATPEEIASMRLPSELAADVPDLTVAFAEVTRDRALGDTVTMTNEKRMVPFDELPDLYGTPGERPFGSALLDAHRPNRQFYREFATYHVMRGLCRRIRVVVSNVGRVAASDVRVVLRAQHAAGVFVVDPADIPERPDRSSSPFDTPAMRDILPMGRRDVGDIDVAKDDEESRAEADCGNIQPGRQVWCEVFDIAVSVTGLAELSGLIYAGNLPAPQRFALTINATVHEHTLSVSELLAIADGGGEDGEPDDASDRPSERRS